MSGQPITTEQEWIEAVAVALYEQEGGDMWPREGEPCRALYRQRARLLWLLVERARLLWLLVEPLVTRAQDAERRFAASLVPHQRELDEDGDPFCVHCAEDWPCREARARGVDGDDEKDPAMTEPHPERVHYPGVHARRLANATIELDALWWAGYRGGELLRAQLGEDDRYLAAHPEQVAPEVRATILARTYVRCEHCGHHQAAGVVPDNPTSPDPAPGPVSERNQA